MKNIRLKHYTELPVPTANIFNSYLLGEWQSSGIPYSSFTITEETNVSALMMAIHSAHTSEQETTILWPSVYVLPQVSTLAFTRNSLKSNLSFSFYINTVQGYQACIKDFLPLLQSIDIFVFNSEFSRTLFLASVPSSYPVNCKVQPVKIPKEEQNFNYESRKYFAILSRCNYSKLLHLAIQSVAKCQHAPKVVKMCLLISDSKFEQYYLEYLKALSSSLGVTLLLEYNIGYERKQKVFSEAFACINLSSTFEETQGKTLIEAVSSGCLAVANNWNGFHENCHPDFLINTFWTQFEGISINLDQLSQVLDHAFVLFRTSPKCYMNFCDSTFNHYVKKTLPSQSVINYCTNRFDRPVSYEELVTWFAHLKNPIIINEKVALTSTLSIDVYLTARKRFINSQPPLSDVLYCDKLFLSRSQATFTWPLLLNSIVEDCLSSSQWMHSDLQQICDLLKRQSVYPDWIKLVSLLFGMNHHDNS